MNSIKMNTCGIYAVKCCGDSVSKVEVVTDYASSASAMSRPALRWAEAVYSTNCPLFKAFQVDPVVGTGRPERGPSPLEHLQSRSEVARRGRSSRPPADPRWRPRDGQRWAAGAWEFPRNAESVFDCARVDWAWRACCRSRTSTAADAAEERTDLSSCRRALEEKRQAADGLGGGEEKARRWKRPSRLGRIREKGHLRRRPGNRTSDRGPRVWECRGVLSRCEYGEHLVLLEDKVSKSLQDARSSGR